LSEPDVLLDSDYIIQRSGENFRKLMLTFEDDTGKSMCLRPDLTVASCIKYLKDNSKANSKFFYSGQAYRRSNSPKDKVINDQLGIEILGSKNKFTDDLKVLKTIANSIKKIKIKNTAIKIGDVSLFQKLIESLKIPERWKMRLKRHFWRPQYFEDLLNRLETNSDVDPAAINLDKKKFSEMKNLDQSKEIASRKISEILSRFNRKIKDPRSFAENKKIVKIIREFLKINCPISKLEKALKSFVKKNNLSNIILKDLSTIKNLSKINSKTIFSTNFGRDIEYYTGIVFEIYNSSKKEIARGGRYDSLLKSLGSKKNISAVGAAINLNNLKT
jgi:ATP phosphoribosyltransferase regulatory subunit